MMLYFWLSLAAILLAIEMLSGTFYLLLLCFGAILGGLTAYLNVAVSWQIITVAIFSVVTMLILKPWNRAKSADMNLDNGEIINISEWNGNRTRAKYRGALWDIELEPKHSKSAAISGSFVIVAQRGNTLVVAPENN